MFEIRTQPDLFEDRTVLHSWCVQAAWHAPTIVGGEGATFWDDRGRTYLDMSSLAECMNLGHQHPAVVQAIRRQAETLCFTTSSWGAQPRAELANLLLEKSGFEGGRVFFTLGGSDANEHAVKFARQAAQKPRGVIVTQGSLLPRRKLRGDGAVRRCPDRAPGARGRLRRRSRASSLRLSLSIRLADSRRVRPPRSRERGRHDRSARRQPGGGRPDGAQRGNQRRRRSGHVLAVAARCDEDTRGPADRRRGDERIRTMW